MALKAPKEIWLAWCLGWITAWFSADIILHLVL